MMTEICFHCAEPVPAGCILAVMHEDVARMVCCVGCQAVAQLIIDGGNGAYYQFREGSARRMDPRELEHLDHWQAFDQRPDTDGNGIASATVLIEGMHCGACAWLIESRVGQHEGVTSVDVDLPSGTATLRWQPAHTRLSSMLIDLTRLGFRPHPLDCVQVRSAHRREHNALLRRLAVSGLGMMQVMMFAVGTYAGVISGIDPAIERLLQGVSMVVAAPVVFYAATPFLAGAWRSLHARSLTMDVPIALALLLAFGTSCVHFFRGAGQTYFESVSMFVFFLLCARWIAMRVRHQSLDAQLALAPMLPDVALRVDEDAVRPIPRSALCAGDQIVVRAGDALPGDGIIEHGQSTLNEALLSGESVPCPRAPGDRVLAGSINLDATLQVRMTAVHARSTVAKMAQHLVHARTQRPAASDLSGNLATRFIQALLVIASIVGLVWWRVDPSRALEVVLAVLVVTCPCALSLAIPTALSAAAARLARHGVLVQRLGALETLAQVRVVLFDKTGTLTDGQFALEHCEIYRAHPSPVNEAQLLSMVAALEQHSSHPLATAFRRTRSTHEASDVDIVAGRGIRGTVDGRRLRAGSADFAATERAPGNAASSVIHVADDWGQLGRIHLRDGWRDDAATVLAQLGRQGLRRLIVSGDQPERVAQAVEKLAVDDGFAACLPHQKLAILHEQQRAGQVTMVIGDGVNDTQFLASADVSVALAEGADMARAAADIVITGRRLQPLLDLMAVARDMPRTVRQNLAWAIGYNTLAVPLAALGLIGPGLAALGMSLSSVVVVLNSARSARSGRARTARSSRHNSALETAV